MSQGQGWRHSYKMDPKFIWEIQPEAWLQCVSEGPSRSQGSDQEQVLLQHPSQEEGSSRAELQWGSCPVGGGCQ